MKKGREMLIIMPSEGKAYLGWKEAFPLTKDNSMGKK